MRSIEATFSEIYELLIKHYSAPICKILESSSVNILSNTELFGF